MVKLDILKEKVKFVSSIRGYSIPLKISIEEKCAESLRNLASDAEGKLRADGLSLLVDFSVDRHDDSIVNLYFREEEISNLNGVIKDFRTALEMSVEKSREREIKIKELEKEQEEIVNKVLDKIKEIKFD